MEDIEIQFLIESYQSKISELMNLNIFFEASIKNLKNKIAELESKIAEIKEE